MAKPAITLYDLSVPTFLQTARAVGGFLDRATRYCAETGADLEEIVRARLFPDMAPFHFQIEALTHHAVWGIEAAKTGVFAPPPLVGVMPFANLRAMVGQAVTALESFSRDEVNSWSGKNLDIPSSRMPATLPQPGSNPPRLASPSRPASQSLTDSVKRHPELPPLRHEELPPPLGS